MKPHLRLLALASMLAVTAVPLTGHAAPTDGAPAGQEEGRARFQRGIELYKEGNYHAALAEFRAANAASPSSRIQYNLGQTLFQLQDYAGALAAFEAYEAGGRDKIPDERLREVDADLAKLRQRVATLKLQVVTPDGPAPAGTVVTIDDEARGAAGPVRVSAGRRKVGVTAPGFQTETRVLDVAGSSVVDLRFELKPIAQRVERPSSDLGYAPPEGSQSSRAPVYVALGGTVALGATAGVLAVLAANKHSAYDDAANQPNPDRAALDDRRSSTKTLALAADIVGGVAIAAGITTIVLAFTTGHRDRGSSAAGAPALVMHGVRVEPHAGARSVGLAGTF
ncbi:MAG: Thiol-disulfide isomerase and thioredoxin [Labilithrix sp.]|nr:Thiol-disulfide isomerase and thioredoxin [Labilithrix sp.]